MKLYPKQFSSYVENNPLLPLYLLSGEEVVLIEEARTLLRKYAQQKGFEDTLILQVDSDFNWQRLEEALWNVSLFQKRKWIEVRVIHPTIPKIAQDILTVYTHQPVAENLFILILTKLEKKDLHSIWYKNFIHSGLVIHYWPLSFVEKKNWVKQYLKKFKLMTSNQGLEYLLKYSEGNTIIAAQNIQKLSLTYAKKDFLELEDIQATLMPFAHYTLLNLTQSIMFLDTQKALEILEYLRVSSIEPAVIFWSLVKELLVLAKISYIKEKKSALPNNYRKYEAFPIISYSYEIWQDCLILASNIEQIIKGIFSYPIWEALRYLILKMTGAPILQDLNWNV